MCLLKIWKMKWATRVSGHTIGRGIFQKTWLWKPVALLCSWRIFSAWCRRCQAVGGGSSGVLLEQSCVCLGNFPGCVAAKFILWFPGRSRRQTNMILKSPFWLNQLIWVLLSAGKNSVQHRWGAQGMKSHWVWKYFKNIVPFKHVLWMQAKWIYKHLAEIVRKRYQKF